MFLKRKNFRLPNKDLSQYSFSHALWKVSAVNSWPIHDGLLINSYPQRNTGEEWNDKKIENIVRNLTCVHMLSEQFLYNITYDQLSRRFEQILERRVNWDEPRHSFYFIKNNNSFQSTKKLSQNTNAFEKLSALVKKSKGNVLQSRSPIMFLFRRNIPVCL